MFEFLAHGGGTLSVERAVLEALTSYTDAKSVEFFVNNLDGTDERKVAAAADVLAAMDCRDSIPHLLGAFEGGKAAYNSARALVKLQAFEPLAELLQSGRIEPEAMRRLLIAFKDSRNPACVEWLLPLLRSPDFGVRRMAAEAIKAADGDAARQGLKRMLPELDFEGLLLCVPALKLTEEEWLNGAMQPYYQIRRAYFDPSYPLDSACTEKLLAILQSGNESVRGRAFAAERLGRNLDSHTASALRQVMRSGVPGVWRTAARTLRRSPELAKDGLDCLLLALESRELSTLDASAKAAISSLPASTVENLLEEDPYGAAKVIDQLCLYGWVPRTPGETAVSHIVRREWSQLANTGDACLKPLVDVAMTDSTAFDEEMRRGAARALEAAVDRLLPELPEMVLRSLAGLSDPVRIQEDVGSEQRIGMYSWQTIRNRIHQELERRGFRTPQL
jgi:hypothetical protein